MAIPVKVSAINPGPVSFSLGNGWTAYQEYTPDGLVERVLNAKGQQAKPGYDPTETDGWMPFFDANIGDGWVNGSGTYSASRPNPDWATWQRRDKEGTFGEAFNPITQQWESMVEADTENGTKNNGVMPQSVAQRLFPGGAYTAQNIPFQGGFMDDLGANLVLPLLASGVGSLVTPGISSLFNGATTGSTGGLFNADALAAGEAATTGMGATAPAAAAAGSGAITTPYVDVGQPLAQTLPPNTPFTTPTPTTGTSAMDIFNGIDLSNLGNVGGLIDQSAIDAAEAATTGLGGLATGGLIDQAAIDAAQAGSAEDLLNSVFDSGQFGTGATAGGVEATGAGTLPAGQNTTPSWLQQFLSNPQQAIRTLMGGIGGIGGMTQSEADARARSQNNASIIGSLLAYKSNQDYVKALQDSTKYAVDKADPFASQRPFYQQQLQSMYTDPNYWTNSPILKSMKDQAINDTNRSLASQGYNMSGNQVMNLGERLQQTQAQYALPMIQQTAGQAGAGFGPGYAGQAASQGGQAAATAANTGNVALGNLFKSIWTGPQTSSGDQVSSNIRFPIG